MVATLSTPIHRLVKGEGEGGRGGGEGRERGRGGSDGEREGVVSDRNESEKVE